MYKRSRGVEQRTTSNKSSQWSERDLNSRSSDFKSGALTTRPHCLTNLVLLSCLLQVSYWIWIKRRKLVFDNIDSKLQTHSWFFNMAIENRVSGKHLSNVKPRSDNLLQKKIVLFAWQVATNTYFKGRTTNAWLRELLWISMLLVS